MRRPAVLRRQPGEPNVKTVAALAASAILLSAAPAPAQEAAARASLVNRQGRSVGTVTLTQTQSGLLHLIVEAADLPPGPHGFHVHAVGQCDPATNFDSAKGHFMLEGQTHGAMTKNGPHAGDLPNVHVGADGVLKAEFLTDQMSLTDGAPNNLRDADGSAVMIHEMADDYVTDMTGDAGARLACGVIQ
jgi:superoxide dismutase, Cu-Zn family